MFKTLLRNTYCKLNLISAGRTAFFKNTSWVAPFIHTSFTTIKSLLFNKFSIKALHFLLLFFINKIYNFNPSNQNKIQHGARIRTCSSG